MKLIMREDDPGPPPPDVEVDDPDVGKDILGWNKPQTSVGTENDKKG